MRKYLLLFFFSAITASGIRAQIIYPTNREIYNFSVGDTFIYSYYGLCDAAGHFCTHYYSMVVTGKTFSSDSNTVYYNFNNGGWSNTGVPWIATSYSDLDSPILQGHSNYSIDTTFTDSNSYCVPLMVADSFIPNGSLSEHFEYKYATGLGKVTDIYYALNGTPNTMDHALQLVYYHKGNVICGTFDSTWLVSGIDKTEPSVKLQLYPNPVSDKLYIKGLQQYGDYSIYDEMGKICKAGKSIDEINVSMLPTGIYFIKITIDKSTVFERFEKQ